MDLATLMFVSYRAMNDRVMDAMREAGYDVHRARAGRVPSRHGGRDRPLPLT